MNHYVPDFEMESDPNLNSTSSTITNHKVDDDILELLWQDGQVVAQPQTQRKPQPTLPPQPLPPLQPPPPPHQHFYMAEDEMATWLHYPLEDLYSELLSENQTSPSFPPISSSVPQPHPSPPPPPTSTTAANNFGLFSRMRGNKDLDKSSSLRPGLTAVESNSNLALVTAGEVSSPFALSSCGGGGGVRLEKDRGGGEVTVSSSSGISGGGTVVKTGPTTAESEDTKVELVMEDRKRKRNEVEESTKTQITEISQDLEHETDDDDEKKHSSGHSTAKRARAAQVHNLSERRRRDRINDRMKALQELIPRCNKSDKASMLDEAIEYLKSLQMQVQMMSMGCNMVPMMYPGYIDMGMAQPMIPYPPNMLGANVPISHGPTVGPQFGPRFSIPPAHVPCVSSSNLAGNEGGNQVVNTVHGSYPVQQYMALQQMQMQIQMQMQQMQAVQNQTISQPGSSRQNTDKSEAPIGPSTSKEEREDDN